MSNWTFISEGIIPVVAAGLCHGVGFVWSLCGHFQGDFHPYQTCVAAGGERQKTSSEKNCASCGKD